MKYTLLLLTLAAPAMAANGPSPPQGPPVKLLLPQGAVKYRAALYTQEIAVTDGRDRISRVPRRNLEVKWQVSGGMVGIVGVTSEKYRTLPEGRGIMTWVDNIDVWNGSNFQPNRGIVRAFVDGTRYDDVLSYGGKVFEHRVREKRNGDWYSYVVYKDEAARPKDYTGLKQSCSSCHDQAGSGGYAAGLVPGGDTVLSEELDWRVLGR